MSKFIELRKGGKEILVNVDQIVALRYDENEQTEIYLNGGLRQMIVDEDYMVAKQKILYAEKRDK